MAGHPLRPATDRRLGRPLPYQLANRTRAHPIARACKQRPSFSPRTYAVLARVSPGCPPLQGRFPRVTHPSATLLAPKDFRVRLACVRHAASVQSEPGSNSSVHLSRPPKRPILAQRVTFSRKCSVDISQASPATTEHPHKLPERIVKELLPASRRPPILHAVSTASRTSFSGLPARAQNTPQRSRARYSNRQLLPVKRPIPEVVSRQRILQSTAEREGFEPSVFCLFSISCKGTASRTCL